MSTFSETPELDNSSEIKELLNSDLQSQRDKATVKAMQNITLGIVNSRFAIRGLGQALGRIKDRIESLDRTIKDSADSSNNLTKAIKKITFWGAIIAGTGVLVAILNLIF